MASEVIPFGKYKGQPVEAMAADQQYTDWLMGQSWFRDKYQNIYTLIVNNFTEPSETPEHNALQALFLNDELCARCAAAAYGDGGDVLATISKRLDEYMGEGAKIVDQNNRGEVFSVDDVEIVSSVKTQFEINGADVHIELCARVKPKNDERWLEAYYDRAIDFGSYTQHARRLWVDFDVWVEVKPVVGDDYPSVLRQMRNTRCRGRPILFVGEYSGVGATREQFIEIFNRAGIKVVFKDDIA